MKVNRINNYNNMKSAPAFQARVKLSPEDVELLIKGGTVSGTLGSSASGAVTGSATTLAGSGFDTLGTAFTLHATGSNSSGIVPLYMDKAASSMAPSVLEATNAHPSVAGSVFSTIGRMLGIKTKINTKDPS